jgi:hypothetical protein
MMQGGGCDRCAPRKLGRINNDEASDRGAGTGGQCALAIARTGDFDRLELDAQRLDRRIDRAK